MFFLLIMINFTPHNKYETIYEKYVYISHNYLLKIHMVNTKLKYSKLSWYIHLQYLIVI